MSKTVCDHQVLIRIFKWVCVKHGITPAALMGPHRQRHLVIAREEFCRRAWKTQLFSAPQIGYAINRDHTTVMYHCGLLKGYVPKWKRAA